MSALDDVGRMLALVPWLLERPGASLTEAADAFGVTPDRIRQDLVDHLDFCGLPGLGGGDLFEVSVLGDRVVVSMADELRRPVRPTPAEALRLILTVDAVAEVLGEELPALRSAVDKVRDALGVPEGLADVVDIPSAAAVVDVRRAIAAGRRVRLRYRGRADAAARERSVDPWRVVVVGGVWYLQGHDHDAGGLRTFRLDRASQVEMLDETATQPAPADVPDPRYEPGPDDVSVRIEVTRGGRWLIDALDVDAVDEGAAGGATLRLTTDAPRYVARLVLMAGGEAVVTDPPQVVEAVRDAASAASRYA